MKNFIAMVLVISLALACNTKSKDDTTIVEEPPKVMNDTVTTPAETTAGTYACPMHPEVTGAKDAECSKCGMPLTEPVGS